MLVAVFLVASILQCVNGGLRNDADKTKTNLSFMATDDQQLEFSPKHCK